MENDWDLSSIVRRCKVTTFTNPSTFCETPPQNLTTTITSTTNSIISPINTSPSCFEDYFIFNQEISPIANKHTMENDWDLSSIVRRCKVTTFTNPSTFCETPPQKLATMVTTTTTNSLVSPINTTPSCFPDFTFNQENSPNSFTSHKPNNFTNLNKLRVNFNSTTHIPTPTTTSIPITITTATSSLTTTTFPTHTNVQISNQNSSFFDFSTSIKQHQMQPNKFTQKNSFMSKLNSTTSIPTLGTTLTMSAITPPTSFTTPTTTISTPTITHAHRQQPKHQSRKR
jgi:hypothetical protein